jgi:hypothetical protein
MRRACLLVILASLCLAAGAQANVASTEEPNFTRGTSNTWWFNWSAAGAFSTYRICFGLSTNGGGSVSQGCTGDLYSQGSGVEKITVTGLQPGSSYVMCATERHNSPTEPELPHVTDCESTIMDAEKPQVSASINGTDEDTTDPRFRLHIDYADTQSPPWFYFDPFNVSPTTAVYGCFGVGATCTPAIDDAHLMSGCGTKNNSHSSSLNSMDCTVDWTGADGKVYFCARVADSALADRPDQANQLAGQTPAEANVSDVGNGCGYINFTRQAAGVPSGGTGGGDGPGGDPPPTGSTLGATAPPRVRRGQRLTVKLSAPAAGLVQATLLRGKKRVTGKRLEVGGAGTYKLKLKVPAGARPGKHRLKLTFAGGGARSTKTLKLKVLR